jgi:hypothetical protein
MVPLPEEEPIPGVVVERGSRLGWVILGAAAAFAFMAIANAIG